MSEVVHIRPIGPGAEEAESQEALAGLKVADFSWVGVGPLTTRYLANHGAAVVRVESIHAPDILRLSPPYAGHTPGINRSAYFANFNANKLGITLNLKSPAGLGIAKRLVAWADIAVESFVPGTIEALGLGYQDLIAIRPDIILLSTSLFGRRGPHSRLRGLGGHLTHVAGFTSATGPIGGAPIPAYGPYTDFLAPRFAVAAVLGALDYRRRTGCGQWLDLSQLEAAVLCLAPELLHTALTGESPEPRANRHPWAAPHNAYPCRGEDRWCAIAVFLDEEWRALRGVMANPDWAQAPEYETCAGRKAHEEQLDAALAAWTVQQDATWLMQTLQAAGVAAGVVQNPADLFADPHLVARGHFQWLQHEEIGPHAYDADCFTLSQTPARYRAAAPLLGQHNDLVLRELLGFDDDEIADLVVAGALE